MTAGHRLGSVPTRCSTLAGALVSFVNFGIHALMTGVIVLATRHVAGRTDDLHVFTRLTARYGHCDRADDRHLIEIAVGHALALANIRCNAGPFEFAFENYVALR